MILSEDDADAEVGEGSLLEGHNESLPLGHNSDEDEVQEVSPRHNEPLRDLSPVRS